MRMTCFKSKTKIFPSPIFPVLADFSMASIAWSSISSLIAASTFTFGRKSTTYSAPRYSSVWPFCLPKPLTSVTVMPCTPIADRASRTSSSLNGLMIAVTSFIDVLPVLIMSFEELELVEALQCDRRHGLARRAGVVGKHRLGCTVSARFDARFEAVGGDVGSGEGHFFVLRARGAKVEAVLVVERFETNHGAELRRSHKGNVAGNAAVLCFGGRTAGAGDVVRNAQDFQSDGQRIDDGVRRDGVKAGAGALSRTYALLAAVAGQDDRQRLDRVQRRAELHGLALVLVGELIPAVVDARDEADRVAQRPGRAHTGMRERYRAEKDGSGDIVVARARDHLGSRQRDELTCDHGQRPASVLRKGLGDIEHGRVCEHPQGG